MKTIEIKTIPVILSGIFILACNHDFEYNHPSVKPIDGKPVEITLKLSPSNSFSSSLKRAMTGEQENEIHNAYIFGFRAGVLSYVKRLENTGSENSFKGTLPASKDPSDTYKLMIVANAEEWILQLIGSDFNGLNGKSYSDVQQALKQTGITNPLFSSGGSIAMWGELPYEEIKNSNKTFSILLLRSIARIDVGLGATDFHPITHLATWGGLSNFVLEEVHLYKPNTGISFTPSTGSYDDVNKAVTRPTPFGTPLTSPLMYAVTNEKSIVQEIYTPEADVILSNPGASGDTNHTNRIALVVKGSYESNPSTYYRLDFINSEKKLVDVLRNHLYQFNVKSVLGNGFSDPDKAYRSLPVNMNVEVLKWNDGSMGEVAFDGQNIISVSTGEFTFPRNQRTEADNDNELTIITDYPSGWVIDKITESPEANSKPSEWLTVSRQSGPENKKTTISLLVEQNTGDNDRTAYIHVEAGRLCYTVKVVQTTRDEMAILFINGSGIEIEELLFRSHVGATVPAQVLNVAWLPKSENTVAGKFSVAGTSEFDFGSGDEIVEGIIVGRKGFTSYNIQPPAMTREEVDADPFLEKASRFVFTVNNGNTSETKSITIRQKNYAAVPTVNTEYPMNGVDQYFTIKANAPWKIEIADDPDNAIAELITVSGGFNRGKGFERIYFKPVNGNGKATSNVVLRVSSTHPDMPFSGFFIPLTLTSKDASFSIECTKTMVRGVYIKNVPLNISNMIWVSVDVSVPGYYDIKTDIVDGISFSATGRFTTAGKQTVMLLGTGVPANTNVKNMTISSNATGSEGTSCTVNVNVVIPAKRLLTLGSEPDNSGFNFSGRAASNRLITTSMNFGMLEGSKVGAEGFNIINGGENPSQLQMQNWLIDYPVDIVVIGYNYTNMTTVIAGFFTEYLNGGGVVLFFQGNSNSVSDIFLKRILGFETFTNFAEGTVYQFSADNIDVLNGPFGDIREKQWGLDANTAIRVGGIDPAVVDILSGDKDLSNPSSTGTDGYVTAFKHKTLNLIWVGDGGFNSNNDEADGTKHPFRIDVNNFPIIKPGYGRGQNKFPVYNSVFTANAFAWAIQQAEFNGINSGN